MEGVCGTELLTFMMACDISMSMGNWPLAVDVNGLKGIKLTEGCWFEEERRIPRGQESRVLI